MGVIKQLKQFITKTNIFPITKTNAVYDDTVGRLDTFMQNILVGSDTLESEMDDMPRDADTLGGHLPTYYAKQSDLNSLIKAVRITGTTSSFGTISITAMTNPKCILMIKNNTDGYYAYGVQYTGGGFYAVCVKNEANTSCEKYIGEVDLTIFYI